MKRSLDMLDDIRIAAPCPAAWGDMVGDDRVRHCSLCSKNVYDISALTRAEATRLIQAPGETPCVRLYRRADGRVLTRDCAVGRALQVRRAARRAVVAVAAWFGVTLVAGCRDGGRGPFQCTAGVPVVTPTTARAASAEGGGFTTGEAVPAARPTLVTGR